MTLVGRGRWHRRAKNTRAITTSNATTSDPPPTHNHSRSVVLSASADTVLVGVGVGVNVGIALSNSSWSSTRSFAVMGGISQVGHSHPHHPHSPPHPPWHCLCPLLQEELPYDRIPSALLIGSLYAKRKGVPVRSNLYSLDIREDTRQRPAEPQTMNFVGPLPSSAKILSILVLLNVVSDRFNITSVLPFSGRSNSRNLNHSVRMGKYSDQLSGEDRLM
mmetsp:Transcript_130478/g.225616  ORF Transcript_130478/g.225616 Transcript_130478/m.225616 type:complete len:219 (-) Transcript_130478:140-796(-)